MKFFLPLAVGASIAEASLVQRDEVKKSSGNSVNTVYSFIGSGSGSKVLQIPSKSSSPKETSDSRRESSALSQLLHASTPNSDKSTAFSGASVTSSPSSTDMSGASDSSSNYTGADAGGEAPSSSFTKSAASSGAANHLGASFMAGGIAVAAIAML